jgi:hypothetical protein
MAVAWMVMATTGCRPDPGGSSYESQEPFPFGDGGGHVAGDGFPGPYPYRSGERRLALGAFYEGGRSEEVALDNVVAHLYVYDETVMMEPDGERLEGHSSTRLVHAGKSWWGLGIHWDISRDLSTWKTLHVSLKSSNAAFQLVKVALNNGQNPFFLEAAPYGWAADGAWHSLAIPVADFVAAGLDATKVTAPFVLAGGPGASGTLVNVDDLYLTAD